VLRELVALAALFLILISAPAVQARDDTRISSTGGQYFKDRVEIAVPSFAQDDRRWSRVRLGRSTDTLGIEGCAVTSAAMVARFYGVRTDPKRLNAFLTRTGGLDGDGLISWDHVPSVAPKVLALAYNGAASYKLIDRSLRAGNPLIAVVPLRDGAVHFVVIVGKEGLSYLIRDPSSASRWAYPLRQRTPWMCGLISFARLG
jgi:hypothetical protein